MTDYIPPSEPNEFGLPIGLPVSDWKAAKTPQRDVLAGRFCRVEGLSADLHADDLFDGLALDGEGRNWAYLIARKPRDLESFRAWIAEIAAQKDPLFYAIIDLATGKAVGMASYMRINPPHGVIEVGSILYTPLLQRKPAATEAMYLMMRHVFEDLGYRRYEWKCNALNGPSRRAAERLGFTYEGTFRQNMVVHDRNRDTAWFSLLDAEWPDCKAALEAWLSPENFDEQGQQRQSLESLRNQA